MKSFIPNFSNLFATWASAGQYGSVTDLEDADAAEPVASKVHTLPKSTGNATAKRHRSTVQLSPVSEPKYFTGSTLVKTKLG